MGIEIESMSDRDIVFAQLPSQADAIAKRFSAIKAATKAETRERPQAIEKGAFFHDAAKVLYKQRRVQTSSQRRKLTLATARLQAVNHQEKLRKNFVGGR